MNNNSTRSNKTQDQNIGYQRNINVSKNGDIDKILISINLQEKHENF